MLRACLVIFVGGLCSLACGGGGDGGGSGVEPMFIPEGGVMSGPIDGVLHVYAIDRHSHERVVGATVVLGDRDSVGPTGTTDATGLVSFEDVEGPQTVTIAAPGYRIETLIGLNAANVTWKLRPLAPPTPKSGHVSGTILGWEDLPAPPAGRVLAGVVTYSETEGYDDPANTVLQPDGDPPPNFCYRLDTDLVARPCAWELETRVGKQTLAAIIALADPEQDYALSFLGVAYRRGVDVAEGESLTGQDLTLIPDSGLADMTFAFDPAPTGLDEVYGYTLLHFADEGFLSLNLPIATPSEPTLRVPALTGDLADATYETLAAAVSATASTGSFAQNQTPGLITVGPWLATPAPPMADGDTYAFQAGPDATVHSVELDDFAGIRWVVLILDDTTSFTLPKLTPDPFLTVMRVVYLELEDFDPQDFRDRPNSAADSPNLLLRTSHVSTAIVH